MSSMQHVVNFPYIESLYESGAITFWFQLKQPQADRLSPNVQKKITTTTETTIQRRQGNAFGVSGYVPAVYKAVEQVAALLQVAMPQMLIDELKRDEEELGIPRPWATPLPPPETQSSSAEPSGHSTAVAFPTLAATPTAIATQEPSSSTTRPLNPPPESHYRSVSVASSGRWTPTAFSTAVAVKPTANRQTATATQYRSATIRTMTGKSMGLARDDNIQRLMADKEDWLEKCPIHFVGLEPGPKRALIECDRTAAMIGHHYATPEMNYDNQKKLLGLCQTLYCHFRACVDHSQLPTADRILLVKKLRKIDDHDRVFGMFYRTYDVIFKRRPPPDLSKELVAYVVFGTAAQAREAQKAVEGTNMTAEPVKNYDFFEKQYRWRMDFLNRLITGQGCRPACLRSKEHQMKRTLKNTAPPPVEQSEVGDIEDDWHSEALEDVDSTWDEVESVTPFGDVEATTEESHEDNGRGRPTQHLAAFPQETAADACRIEVPHRTLTWMMYNALDHRWDPSEVKSASEYEYVRWNDEQVIHVCDSICNTYPSFYNSIMGKLRHYDWVHKGNIAAKFNRFRGRRRWEQVDMFSSRKGPKILSMSRRFASHIHEIRQPVELISVIEDLKRLRNSAFPVVTLDTEGCSSGERKGCRLLQLCTPTDAFLIDVWMVGKSFEFADFIGYLFDENNGLCRFGFHFDATPTRLSGDRKELATMFDSDQASDKAIRHRIVRATVHDVRRLVVQTKGLNEEYVERRPRLSHFCLYVLGYYMDKSEQKSCWGVEELRPSQKKYATLDAVIPLLIVEECKRLKPDAFEAFRRMTVSATWNGEEDTDDEWWINIPAVASATYQTANQ